MTVASTSRTQVLKSGFEADPKTLSRPIITFINGDVSWLVSFPRPASGRSTTGKVYYHVVVDPWFGQQSVFVSTLVISMELGRDPGLKNREDVDAAIVEIELAAGYHLVPTDNEPAVDAIMILGMAEHFNEESLLQFSSCTPLFTISANASAASSWGHFKTVVTLPTCDTTKVSWKQSHPGSPLPEWLTVTPLKVTRSNNYGTALTTSANPSEDELILMSPHGIHSDEPSIKPLLETTKMLALVAPFKNSYAFGMKTVFGLEEGLAITHEAGSRFYVRSGDFVSLKYTGVIGWSVRDEPHELEWGLDQLRKRVGDGKIHQPTMVEVDNGESYMLV